MSYETSYDPSSDKIIPICRQSVKMLLSSCGRAVTDSVSRLGKKWKMENVLSEGVGGLPIFGCCYIEALAKKNVV